MKHLALFPGVEYLEAYCEQVDEDLLKSMILPDIGRKIEYHLEMIYYGTSYRTQKAVKNYNALLELFWKHFYSDLTFRSQKQNASKIWTMISEDTLRANFIVAALYTFLELKKDDDYVSYMDILIKLDSKWETLSKHDLVSVIEALKRAEKDEYPANDHSVKSNGDIKKTGYYANAYLDLRVNESKPSSIEIGGYDKVLPLQMALNHHLVQSRLGMQYKKNSDKNQNGQDKGKLKIDLINSVFTKAPIEDKTIGLFKIANKEQKQRKKYCKSQLRQILEALYTIDSWDNPLTTHPFEKAIYMYEKELLFHRNAISLVLDLFEKGDVTNKNNIIVLMVIACLNPMVIGNKEILNQILKKHDWDGIEETLTEISNTTKAFCAEFYYTLDCNLDRSIEVLEKYIDRNSSLFFSDDKCNFFRGNNRIEFTEENIDRIIKVIDKRFSSSKNNDGLTELFEKIWELSLAIMIPYEHNEAYGIKNQFDRFKSEHLLHRKERRLNEQQLWEARDIRETTGDVFISEEDFWYCDPKELFAMCKERQYDISTNLKITNMILAVRIGKRQGEVNRLKQIIKESASEEEFLKSINTLQ